MCWSPGEVLIHSFPLFRGKAAVDGRTQDLATGTKASIPTQTPPYRAGSSLLSHSQGEKVNVNPDLGNRQRREQRLLLSLPQKGVGEFLIVLLQLVYIGLHRLLL